MSDSNKYIVIVRGDDAERDDAGNVTKPASYVLSTRQVFDMRADAQAHADRPHTCSREPIVVEGRFWELRSTPHTGSMSPLERIARVLYPDGNVNAEFDSGWLGDVCEELTKADLDIWAFREGLEAALAELGYAASDYDVRRAEGTNDKVAVVFKGGGPGRVVVLDDCCEAGHAPADIVLNAIDGAKESDSLEKVWERIWDKTWKPVDLSPEPLEERWRAAVWAGKTTLGLDAWLAKLETGT